MIKIENDFQIEQIVFLKHDIDQKPRMVSAIIINKDNIMYELISGTEVSNHNSFELSSEKIIY